MRKRGISSIVTTVLVILIALVAIAIVWIFVQPPVTKILGTGEGGSGEQGRLLSCFDLDLKAENCDLIIDGNRIEVGVRRGAGQGQLREIKFLFKTSNGNIILSETNNFPGEFGFEVYDFNLDLDLGGASVESVDVAGVLSSGLCDFSGLEAICTQQASSGNIPPVGACGSYKIINLSDFDLDTCTRIRNGLLNPSITPLPVLGLHSVGSSSATLSQTNQTGVQYHRSILDWYNVQNGTALTYNFTGLDAAANNFKNANMKFLLTVRSNHPDLSTVSFTLGGIGLQEPDSYPKSEQQWTDYIKNITDRYYNNPVYRDYFVGVQIGNEWGHQFEVNASYDYGPLGTDKEVQILSLMNISYLAVKEVAPSLPVLTFGVTGVDNAALYAGFNEDSYIIDGFYYRSSDGRPGIKIVTLGDREGRVTYEFLKAVAVNGSAYYDYLDIHTYHGFPQQGKYIANLVRAIWRDNGITGKGLSSTEYSPAFYNFSQDYYGYSIKSGIAIAQHAGFDSITLSHWFPPLSLQPNFRQVGLIGRGGRLLQIPIGNFTEINFISKNFSTVRKEDNIFYFKSLGNNKYIDITQHIPTPSLFQCRDGLDNDYDGFTDDSDPDCFSSLSYFGACNATTIHNESAGIIDPCGFSEDANWIFQVGL